MINNKYKLVLLPFICLLLTISTTNGNTKKNTLSQPIWKINSSSICNHNKKEVFLVENNLKSVSAYSIENGKSNWSKEIEGRILNPNFYIHYSFQENPLFFYKRLLSEKIYWINLLGKEGSVINIDEQDIFSDNSFIYTKDIKNTCSIYGIENGYPLITKHTFKTNHDDIFKYENNILYCESEHKIYALKNNSILWINELEEWDDPDDPDGYYKSRYESTFQVSENYIIAYRVVYRGCCLYHDYTIRILDKHNGETVKDITGNCGAKFVTQNGNLFYTKGYDNAITNERWRRVYDNQGHTNTLYKMNLKTPEYDWTLQSDEYNYVITKREQVWNHKLYILLYDDCKYDEPLVHNKLQEIDVNTGEILNTFEFENNIEEFGVADKYLLIEDKNGVTCYVFNEEDTPKPESKSLSFQVGSNKYTPDNEEPVEMDSKPVIKNGRTLLPARYVCEPLGGQVFWDGDERKVTCKLTT